MADTVLVLTLTFVIPVAALGLVLWVKWWWSHVPPRREKRNG